MDLLVGMQEPRDGAVEQTMLQEDRMSPCNWFFQINDPPQGNSVVILSLNEILVDPEALLNNHLF